MANFNSFSHDHAILYGVECAILINILEIFSKCEQFSSPEFPDSSNWIVFYTDEIQLVCPFWKIRHIELLLIKLVMDGFLIERETDDLGRNAYAFKNEHKIEK